MKIAAITCYGKNDYAKNDYVRARTLRKALAACSDVEMIIIRNQQASVLRYLEVAFKVCKTRLIDRPDAYAITFRGYEMLLFMAMTFVRKPIIFDELVNFTEWMEEHGRLRAGSLPYRLFRRWYGWLSGHSRMILADTDAHAKHSAILNKLSIKRYVTIPVGTDEKVFYPPKSDRRLNSKLRVLYYGNMLALHGLEHVLDAALLLKDQANISFRLIGGDEVVAEACARVASSGGHIEYESWLPFDELPEAIHSAGLTLGGPFGGTRQADFVITGKTYQALACAAPVLIGKNQVNEGFTDKVNCLMVPQANPAALAEAITWASKHPKELAAIGQAGRQLYEQHFSQQIINDRIHKIIEEL